MRFLSQLKLSKTFSTIARWSASGPALVLASSVLITAILTSLDFNLLEANLYDLRMARGTQAKADPEIVLITIDDATTYALDEFAPLPLDMHALFMEEMERLEPRAVGYLIDFNRVDQANPDLVNKKDWATRFIDSANRLQSRGITVVLGTPYDVTGEVLPPFPLSALNHSVAVIHKDSNVFAEDKITRRALVQLNGKAAFHVDFARRLGLIPGNAEPRGTFNVPEASAKYFFFRYHGSTTRTVEGDSLPYKRISFSDVVRGTVAPGSLKGKIALVGTMTREDAGDYAFTPYSKSSFTNPKIAVHASILDSVMHDDGIVRLPGWLNWIATFAATLFVLWWVLNSTPLYGVFATLSLALVIMVVGQVLFQSSGIWLKESSPMVGIFLSYYLGAPYRLIREYKKRWDYQRKNELLTQVEQLKTNFLSLVTHDLKTPVARIQGLAEVLLSKASTRLVDTDRHTIRSIVNATDELNKFITSILELSKVESNRLQINRESKDINQIVERLIEGFVPQARMKNIRLTAQLEPLFPIRIDANLITKVLSNLIDNALKYSTAGSEVRVESREVDSCVEIAVHDQGIGLKPEEMQNLFTRFYRVKNDNTSETPGTGLGLYLTKFFVEAHDGRVVVESEPGKGSTFKIILPIDSATPSASASGASAMSGLTVKLSKAIKVLSRKPAGKSVAEANAEAVTVESQE